MPIVTYTFQAFGAQLRILVDGLGRGVSDPLEQRHFRLHVLVIVRKVLVDLKHDIHLRFAFSFVSATRGLRNCRERFFLETRSARHPATSDTSLWHCSWPPATAPSGSGHATTGHVNFFRFIQDLVMNGYIFENSKGKRNAEKKIMK